MDIKPKLGIGSVQFGTSYGISNRNGQTSEEEVKRILNVASLNQIKLIDTAVAYGNAEQVLGKCDISDFEVVSKFMPPGIGNSLEQQLNQSLEKLNLSFLYGYLAHRPMSLVDSPQLWEQLLSLKRNGLIKKIGYSLNEPVELELLLRSGFFPDIIQVPFNIFDRRFEGLLTDLVRSGCEVHSRSVFLQGLFFMPPDQLSSFFDSVKALIVKLQTSTTNLAGDLLKFVLDKPFIHRVIIGVNDSKQLESNLNAINESSDLFNIIESISENILIPSRWPKN
jgi:aryl-alcohol dehydrogenase-like predicted oxidoreductase